MTIYRRGDVILVEIAFSGAVGSKRRPAVVISVEAFNRAGIKLIVAAVTGNVSPPWSPRPPNTAPAPPSARSTGRMNTGGRRCETRKRTRIPTVSKRF
jgi:mRNA-degrading endonuclease toxin of MazEF toxin-antitoxin module